MRKRALARWPQKPREAEAPPPLSPAGQYDQWDQEAEVHKRRQQNISERPGQALSQIGLEFRKLVL